MEKQNVKGLHPDAPVISYYVPLTRQEAIDTGLSVPEGI